MCGPFAEVTIRPFKGMVTRLKHTSTLRTGDAFTHGGSILKLHGKP